MGRTLAVVGLVLAVLSHAIVGLRVMGTSRVTARAGSDAILRITIIPDSWETIKDVLWFRFENPRNRINTPKYLRYSTLSDGSLKIQDVKPTDKGAYYVYVFQTDGNKPFLKRGYFHTFLWV